MAGPGSGITGGRRAAHRGRLEVHHSAHLRLGDGGDGGACGACDGSARAAAAAAAAAAANAAAHPPAWSRHMGASKGAYGGVAACEKKKGGSRVGGAEPAQELAAHAPGAGTRPGLAPSAAAHPAAGSPTARGTALPVILGCVLVVLRNLNLRQETERLLHDSPAPRVPFPCALGAEARGRRASGSAYLGDDVDGSPQCLLGGIGLASLKAPRKLVPGYTLGAP